MSSNKELNRPVNLLGATSIGVSAIVGGGILVLGGVALRETGPSAVVAFGINGVIAFLTALSIAEMATLFPQSGGIYVFAKRIVSIRAGFAFGWIMWLARLIAALLYALGFAAYATETIRELGNIFLKTEGVLVLSPRVSFTIASLSVLYYSLTLIRSPDSSSNKENIVKLFVFLVLIASGLYVFFSTSPTLALEHMSPFLPQGLGGLGVAMGLTFIALQGFEVVASVAGEIRDPRRAIPKAMFLSLGIALLVYLPLLFVVITVGVPFGESVHEWCGARVDTCLADAARNYLGPIGYWLVIIAALFATLSALQANLRAASSLVRQMAEDRTLPRILCHEHSRFKTPVVAIILNFVIVIFLVGIVPTVALAGSAAGLVFLAAFTFAHVLSYLARKRSNPQSEMFRAPFFPMTQVLGGLSCISLAIFQGVAEPGSALIILGWLAIGISLYRVYLSNRAEACDAYIQALRPEYITFRGYKPLVLLPITNPATAPALVSIAHALAAHDEGRVLLLKVVNKNQAMSEEELHQEIERANAVLRSALLASTESAINPAEALLTISDSPWREIRRVAKQHSCRSLVLGVSQLDASPMESLLNETEGDIAILKAPPGWKLSDVRRILVPLGGQAHHDMLRARVLGMFLRQTIEQITLISVIPEMSDINIERKTLRNLKARNQDETGGVGNALLLRKDDVASALLDTAQSFDLILLGLTLSGRKTISFSGLIDRIAKEASCATLIIGRRV